MNTEETIQMFWFSPVKFDSLGVRTREFARKAANASKNTGFFAGTVMWSSSGFQLGSSMKTRSIEECTLDKYELENAKSYNKQFITRKVV